MIYNSLTLLSDTIITLIKFDYLDTGLGYFGDFEKLLQKEIFIRLLEK